MKRNLLLRATAVLGALTLSVGVLAVSMPPIAAVAAESRLWGDDRYETAVAVSQQLPAGQPAVFIASGADYPDALSATAASALVGGPVLLTRPTVLPSVVAMEIRRLKPSSIHVLGGPAVVSDAVLRALEALVPDTDRLYGADRYATSRTVAARFFTTADTVVLATGRSFADALVAGATAGRIGAPTVLIDGDRASLDVATRAQLKALKTREIILAGGHGSISIPIEQQLRTEGFDVRRLGGASRYETAVQLMDAAGDEPPAGILLTSGEDFPDALAAASLAAQTGSDLYLTRAACVPTAPQQQIQAAGSAPRTAIGGVSVVSDRALDNVGCGDVPPVNPAWKTSGFVFSTTVDAPYTNDPPVDVHDPVQKQLDSTGLRIVNMGPNGSRVDHPVAYAQYGISALIEYQSTGDPIWLERTLRHAVRLEEMRTERGDAWYFPYLFDWTYAAKNLYSPWWSAMAQGEALSLFVRLYEETGDERWRSAADHTWLSLTQPRSAAEPWATMTDQGLLVFEEYAGNLPPLKVLNGHLFALFGVYDYWRLTGDPEAVAYLDGAATTVLEVMPEIRVPGGVSYYCWQDDCSRRYWQNPTYHVIHSGQLDTVARLTGDERFSQWASTLRSDWAPVEMRRFTESDPVQPETTDDVVDMPQ
ncbi:cell wall-binding repeat-containing protein [Microbacterium sp.]|uniref:cell wall-binding repeat-containing protein n=1 Tax=Microbacterium sp. TaxID=51671 RepID=UPI0035675858